MGKGGIVRPPGAGEKALSECRAFGSEVIYVGCGYPGMAGKVIGKMGDGGDVGIPW